MATQETALVCKPDVAGGGGGRYVRWLAAVTDSPVYSLRDDGSWFAETGVEHREIGSPALPIVGRRVVGSLLDRLEYAYWQPPAKHDVVVTTQFPTRAVVHRPGQKRVHLMHGIHRGSLGFPARDHFSSNAFMRSLQKMNRLFIRQSDTQSLAMADAIVVNSRFIQDMAERYYDCSPDAVIPPPIDIDSYENRRPVDREFFLYVGRLADSKGVRNIVEAFEDIEVDLLVAGDGPLRAELERMATDNVDILGYVSEARKRKLLGTCTGFVQNTIAEPFGITTVEALAAGAPVVAVADGNNPYLVEDMETGVLFNRANPEVGYQRPQSVEPLRVAVETVLEIDWEHEAIAESATPYDRSISERKWRDLLANLD